MRVIVSFDPDYGDRERADLGDAFWLIESPANRRLAQAAWASGPSDPNSAVFRASYGPGEPDSAIAIFENVDLHHPNWTEIDIDAVADVAELSRRLAELGFSVSPTANGLVVTR
jgi:hypothetical protein